MIKENIGLQEFINPKRYILIYSVCNKIAGIEFPCYHRCNEQSMTEYAGYTVHEDTKFNRRKLWKLGVR